MNCVQCGGTLESMSLKGYRFHIASGRGRGPQVTSKSCIRCGLIHFFDPRYPRADDGGVNG